MEISDFLNKFAIWCCMHADIVGCYLVGSWTTGLHKATSDIDLVVITTSPAKYIKDDKWIYDFGKVSKVSVEDWGNLKSKRVFYKNDMEVEFGFTNLDWIELGQSESKKVLSHGYKILNDKRGYLKEFIDELNIR